MALDVVGRHGEARSSVRVAAAHPEFGWLLVPRVPGPRRHRRGPGRQLHGVPRRRPPPPHLHDGRSRLPGPDVADAGGGDDIRAGPAGTWRGDTLGPRPARCGGRRGAAHRLLEHVPQLCAAPSRSPTTGANPNPTGSWRRPPLATPSPHTRSASHRASATRWTGTTRSLAAPCAGRRRTNAWRRAGTRSSWQGLGVRCVSDRPWVTGAETCELALALCAIGEHARAADVFADMQHLRHDDGSYWTGYVYTDDARWPEERTTWTGAAVLLAAAVLAGEPVTSAVFGGSTLPVGPDETVLACDDDACAAQGP